MKNFILYASLCLLIPTIVHASATQTLNCGIRLGDATDTTASQRRLLEREARKRKSEFSDRVEIYKEYKSLVKSNRLDKLIPEDMVLDVLTDAEFPFYSQNLKTVLDAIQEAIANKPSAPLEKLANDSFRELLGEMVPASSIGMRVNDLLARSIDKPNALRRALGDLTFDEAYAYSFEMLDQYIKETGARSILRRFSDGHGQSGPARRVVALSAETLPVYLKLFSKPNFLAHFHTPNQGTLMLLYDGKVGSYGRIQNDLQDNVLIGSTIEIGTLMPHIVLKTTEGLRAKNYFELAATDETARTPWELQQVEDRNGRKRGSYCAMGGYASCTHWVGLIPVGDKTLDKIWVPGFVDEHADNHLYEDNPARDAKPRVKRIGQHAEEGLAEIVFKQGEYNEPLYSILGLKEAHVNGELANPGWVARSLLGSTTEKRVPFVFLKTENHRRVIPKDFPVNIRAY